MRQQIDQVRLDVVHAWRSLRKSPVYALAAIATLGLGVGGATAVVTLLNRVVLAPFPYPSSSQLVRIVNQVPCVGEGTEWQNSSAQFFYYGEHADAFDALGGYTWTNVNIQTPDGAQRAERVMASASMMPILGVRATVGRLITPSDDEPGSPNVVMLSHEFWTTWFGGDSSVVGRTIIIDEGSYEVIGVFARGLEVPGTSYGSSAQIPNIMAPIKLNPAGPFYNSHYIPMIARLAPTVSVEAAGVQLANLTKQLPTAFTRAYSDGFVNECGFKSIVYPLKTYAIGSVAANLWIITAGVGLVLLIAAANVTNLFLVRLEERRREFALRVALGAGTGAVVRSVLAETLTVSLAGGLAGSFVAFAGVKALTSYVPDAIPRLNNFQFDVGAVVTAAVLSMVVGLVLAAVPTFRTSRSLNASALAEGTRSVGVGRSRQGLRSALVVLQVAMALTLTVGASVLVSTILRLRSTEPGIHRDGVITMQLTLPARKYASDLDSWRFYNDVLTRIRSLPNVLGAGMSQAIPLTGGYGCTVQGFEDNTVRPRIEAAGLTTCAGQEPTTPGFFEALGIPLLRGRTLTDEDHFNPSRGAVVVSQAFADRFWPNEDPIGKGVGPSGQDVEPFYRVVGVVGDVFRETIGGEPGIAIYYPISRLPGTWNFSRNSMHLVVNSDLDDPRALLGSIRGIIQQVDPAIPMANLRTTREIIDDSMGQMMFTTLLLEVTAVAALLLAAVGLYGVVSYVVSRKTREIGMRIAIGAQPHQVRNWVIRKSIILVSLGFGLGVVLALGSTRIMEGFLFGLDSVRPMIVAVAIGILGFVTLIASWIPARRAAGIDPMEALRME